MRHARLLQHRRCKDHRRLQTPGAVLIHAVGPIWRGGLRGESTLLASCYERALALAAQRRLASIAFPSISTGVYGYPIELAATIAVGTVRTFVREEYSFERVVFCCFSQQDLAVYQRALD